MKTGDFSKQSNVRKEMMNRLRPVGEVIKEEDVKLNTAIKGILNKKQYKKWIKYNKKIYKFFPVKQE